MDAIVALFRRISSKNIAGVLGVIGVLIPLVKELTIVVVRILAIFAPGLELYIDKITGMFIIVEKIWDNIKRFFLGLQPNPLK